MQRIIEHRVAHSFLTSLEQLRVGSLTIVTPDGTTHQFGDPQSSPHGQLHLRTWDVIVNAARRGDIGLGEDYIAGQWESDDIGALIEVFLRNMHIFDAYAHGNIIHRSIFRLLHLARSNRRGQSRRNIRSHYDVGNEFYSLWLDESMTYSSALFHHPQDDLHTAQQQKYQRMLDRATGGSGSHVLEIGCGWGGFAQHAAERDHHVTALTISDAQHRFATSRLERHGLLDRVRLKLQDYRDSSGLFDAIVSIEMFEAVGERYWPSYFRTLKSRLHGDGRAMVQTITVDDSIFDDYRTRSDFIRRYTFPGGMLPSVQRFREEAEKAGLACRDVYAFGRDYARTLRLWLERFDANRSRIVEMGYSPEFIRSWRFYLGMCIGAFNAERTNVVQVELAHA